MNFSSLKDSFGRTNTNMLVTQITRRMEDEQSIQPLQKYQAAALLSTGSKLLSLHAGVSFLNKYVTADGLYPFHSTWDFTCMGGAKQRCRNCHVFNTPVACSQAFPTPTTLCSVSSLGSTPDLQGSLGGVNETIPWEQSSHLCSRITSASPLFPGLSTNSLLLYLPSSWRAHMITRGLFILIMSNNVCELQRRYAIKMCELS